MQPMYVSIQQKETGNRIKSLLKQNGYTVKDIQGAMGFENPQAVYKWLAGRSLPSIDNFVILSRLLNTSIEDILVIDGDIVRLWGCYINQQFSDKNCPDAILTIRSAHIESMGLLGGIFIHDEFLEIEGFQTIFGFVCVH